MDMVEWGLELYTSARRGVFDGGETCKIKDSDSQVRMS